MLGGRSHAALMVEFIAAHQNATNRRFHLVGIPLLVFSAGVWASALFF